MAHNCLILYECVLGTQPLKTIFKYRLLSILLPLGVVATILFLLLIQGRAGSMDRGYHFSNNLQKNDLILSISIYGHEISG